MTNAKYRALTALRYPANPAEVRKKKKGEWPIEWTSCEAGDVVDSIPPESVKWLLADGLIEPATAKPKEEEVTDG